MLFKPKTIGIKENIRELLGLELIKYRGKI